MQIIGQTHIVLDLDVPHIGAALEAVLGELDLGEAQDAVAHAIARAAEKGPDQIENGVAIVHGTISEDVTVQVLVRLAEPISEATGDDAVPVQYIWLLLSAAKTHPSLSTAIEFMHLLGDPEIRAAMDATTNRSDLEAVYQRGLQSDVKLSEHHLPPELQRTGRFAGALIADVKRRAPVYASDFTDGLSAKSLASVFFLFFACLAPAVAFGGLLSVLTGGQIGAVEMIVATALCGTVYALTSGQPLTILGSTGPVIIFMGILYSLCQRLEIPYLPTLSWVGLWTMVMLVVLAVTDACSWIRYFTRFTDDTFAALISLIFIYEAVVDIFHAFAPDAGVPYDTALLSMILALGTYGIATSLSRFRQSDYLRRWVREFLADFGPTIAIGVMTLVALYLHPVELETLGVPEQFGTTTGRGWIVNPLEAPKWVWGAAALPALLVTILLYLDQNITVRLINNPAYKLKKGSGYHLDLAVVGVLVGICSLFGLPWMVAATVRSLNHVRSLSILEQRGGQEVIVGTVETRVTGLFVHLLVGGSLLLLGVLQKVPMSVLFGLFLFMGVASMKGNQLFERLRLWAMDPERYPTTYYLRAVPKKVVHRFTAIQAVCLGVLWAVKTSVLGILFPLFIALLVPVRMIMGRYFAPQHLALLDAEEAPEDEEFRETE